MQLCSVQFRQITDTPPNRVPFNLRAQAPEQAVGKKRGLSAQFVSGSTSEEVTREDRQKMRRKMKKKQQQQPSSSSSSSASSRGDSYEDLKKDSRVLQTASDRSSGKSEYSKSADFFSRLQEEVSTRDLLSSRQITISSR